MKRGPIEKIYFQSIQVEKRRQVQLPFRPKLRIHFLPIEV
jgi:hypothetical protein